MKFSFSQDVSQPGYLMKILVDHLERDTMERIVDRGARLLAAHVIRGHKKAILDEARIDLALAKMREVLMESK